MPGTKRKASFATPYERPSKLSKRTTSSTVAIAASVPKSPHGVPKFPPLKVTKSISKTTIEVSASASLSDDIGSPSPPSLRRASTLTLEDSPPCAKSSSAKDLRKSTSKDRPVSLSKKSSSFVEEGALVTKLSGLKSGSFIGETSLTDVAALTKLSIASKSLSKKSSSIRSSSSSKGPSIPSGLTKLALTSTGSKSSLRVSKSSLIDNVDETEMSTALATLRSHLSKIKSVKLVSDKATADAGDEMNNEKEEENDEAGTSTDPAPGGAHLPPGGLLEIAISFDTTGSMYGCLNEVKAKVQDLVQRLQADIPGIRIAIIAHGDYCDVSTYIVKWIDFGASLPEICNFVEKVGRTSGGDGPECYELVMVRAREALTWTAGSQRVLVIINDDVPHEPGYIYGGITYHINWRDECAKLRDMGVKIYGVQSGKGHACALFNNEMALLTNGNHVELDNFRNIFDYLMMICYREGNSDMLQVYEKEIRARNPFGVTTGMDALTKKFGVPSSSGPLPGTPIFGTRLLGSPPLLGTPMFGTRLLGSPPLPGAPMFGPRFLGSPPLPGAPMFGTRLLGSPPLLGTPLFGTPVIRTTTKAKTVPKKIKAKTGRAKAEPKVIKTKSKCPKAKKTVNTAKKIEKGRKNVVPKVNRVLKREKVPDSNLNKGPFKNFVWSKWVCGITPDAPPAMQSSNFMSCKHYPGYRLKSLFNDETRVPAVYDFGVHKQGVRGRKKHVVYVRKTVGWKKTRRWDMYLLRHKAVKQEVDKILAGGWSIFVRRAVPKGSSKIQTRRVWAAYAHIRDNYDYAWKKYIWRKEGGQLRHREVHVGVKSGGLVISHNTL